ncbi:2849_t:CDS:10 [Ambispora leptoticha]|uniref:2849_t:CDS:1 n=1 Tax=Ambispora leptoticha TaxID=144679 RepID=A0A9N8ZKX5_9GLOM|nr:2849_t:CDS:10 [Ambispora leptoticha]
MSQTYIKNKLKKAKDAIQAKNYEETVNCCENVISYEPENYNAHVFLGVAYLNLNRLEESERSYRKAIEIDTAKPLAWEGLEKFYEKQKNWEKYEETLDLVLQRRIESRDEKVLETINKLIDLHKTKKINIRKLVAVLKNFLPQSKSYDLIKNLDGVPTPIQTLCEIAKLLEHEETESLRREVETRRQRLHAGPLATIKAQVQTEIYSNSELEEIYENLIEAMKSSSEESGVDLKELSIKFLTHLHKKLAAVPQDRKKQLNEKLHGMACHLVDQKYEFALSYEILIESTNAGSLDDYDITLLRQYVELFPDTALSKSIQGYLRYKDGDSIDEITELFNDDLENDLQFLFTYHALSWMHHDSKDYENALEYALSGCELATQKSQEMCLALDRYERSLELIIADCYLHIGGKYYTDASRYYQKILEQEPDNLLALVGYGMVLSAQKQYNKAMEILERAQQLDPNNLLIQNEIGWVHFLFGDFEEAKRICLAVIELCDNNPLYFYRLGRIYWAMDGEYRINKEYAYAKLYRTIEIDTNFAGAFTYLGHYYCLVGDNVRAKRCYMKAFSLDSSDEEAALHLSQYYHSEDNNELAETVYRTIIQSNPKAGWAWKRLGFLELANKNYTDAITAFQTALRTNSKDIQCLEGLAESYRNEGKYIASLKVFTRAAEIDPSSIFANYQIAAIKQKLGFFTEAIEYYKITIEKAKEKAEPDHFPSLKSSGDSYLALVKEYFQMGSYGRAADSIADGLKVLLRAIQMHPEMQCLWKLVGDLCMEVRFIPNYLHLIPLSTLRSVIENLDPSDINKKLGFPSEIDDSAIRSITEEDDSIIDVYSAILTCSCISYKYAIILSGNDSDIAPSYWYDLAVVYHRLYEHERIQAAETSLSYLRIAIRCIKIALRLEPANPSFWNTLGVITLTTNAKISQHAFIKAIEYSQKDPVPWTNIGFLYLINSNLELANKAFSNAQTIDPDFFPSWAGQAYVANLWGSEEALELFEHTFIISGGICLPEANYSYACKCFQTHLSDASSNSDLLHSPSFALQKLIELNPDDATALNLLGLILERLEQPMTASEAFIHAIRSLENSLQNQKTENIAIFTKNLASAQANLARVLCAIGDFSGSINAYLTALELIGEEFEGEDKDNTSLRIYSQLGAGLAYYFDNQLESSLSMFEMALNGTEEGSGVEEIRKDVTVLLSQVLWALQGEQQRNLAQEELFRCISQNPNHLPAIFGLCAIGLLQNNETLATAALQEMKKLPLHISGEFSNELDRNHDIDFLTSRYHLLLDSPIESTLSLVKSVHATPTNLQTWTHLTNHLISTASASQAISSARSSLKLLAASSSSTRIISTLHNAKIHQNLAAALLLKTTEMSTHMLTSHNENEDERKNLQNMKEEYVTEAFYEAQRAVLAAPWDLGMWSLLGVANRTFQTLLFSLQ